MIDENWRGRRINERYGSASAKGYEVVSLSNATDLDECDCCVVTGMDSNIMGMQTTTTKVPVIEASGLSAEEVCKEVENKLH